MNFFDFGSAASSIFQGPSASPAFALPQFTASPSFTPPQFTGFPSFANPFVQNPSTSGLMGNAPSSQTLASTLTTSFTSSTSTSSAVSLSTTLQTIAFENGTHFGDTPFQPTVATSTSSVPVATATPVTSFPLDAALQISIASYINPVTNPEAWTRLLSYDKNKISVLVANVLNGPDSAVQAEWKQVIDSAIRSGQRVLGYVQTGYYSMSRQNYTTRLGSTDLADWTAQIEQDVDKWYGMYGDGISGIFFDESLPICGENNLYANLASYINQNTKRKHPNAFTVLNPGVPMPQCFENAADTLMTFESSYEAYMTSYVGSSWTPSDARKIWHVIYDVPQGKIAEVAALARQRGVGHVQITDDILPNPYNDLPDDAYMQKVLDTVSGGTPNIQPMSALAGKDAAPLPGQVSISTTDWTSIGLSWPASTAAYGYRLYLNDSDVLNLPSNLSRVRVADLAPGTVYTIHLTTLGSDGSESPPSNTLVATTSSLPNGKIVTNIRDATTSLAGPTAFEADILIPYIYKRIFIPGLVGTDCGWGISFSSIDIAPLCAEYMVEGTTLFRYTGVRSPAGQVVRAVPATWSWAAIGSVTVELLGDKYTYRWTVPLGNASADPSRFVMQTQGYGPYQNVWHPCPAGGNPANVNGTYCV